MKSFLLKVLIFSILVIGLILSFICYHQIKYSNITRWNNSETESNLLVMSEEKSYDLLFLGASNARVLSRNSNHQEVQENLGKSIINLAQGGGRGGVVKNYTYLSYFFKKNNSTKHIIYFLPPQTLFTNNYDQLKMDVEPFSFDFLMHSKKAGLDNRTLLNYVQSKFTHNWISKIPEKPNVKSLSRIDSSAIAKNISNWARYEEESPASFEDKLKYLSKIIDLSEKYNCKLSFVFQVNLMGENFPHLLEVKRELNNLQTMFNFQIYDLSNEMTDPSFYYDHMHLNSEGVIHFSKNVLSPIIEES